MDAIVPHWPPPPAAGQAKPGNLYADLQTRTLWLGVDPAVDPAQAVLISDILTLTSMIDDAVDAANGYTDTQILTRAPTTHTHTSSQITDFAPAVTAVVNAIPGANWVRGMILNYSGSLANIGVGDLAGWSLCDGSNGTPDLRDRFIIGAGNKLGGATNTTTSFNTSNAGAHTPTINAMALTLAQIPAHGHNVTVSGGGTFTSGGQSQSHTHTSGNGQPFLTPGGNPGGDGGNFLGAANNTNWADRDHTHTVNVSFASTGSADQQGGSQAHTHTAAAVPDHFHVVTSAQVREATPYYALAFIMKL